MSGPLGWLDDDSSGIRGRLSVHVRCRAPAPVQLLAVVRARLLTVRRPDVGREKGGSSADLGNGCG